MRGWYPLSRRTPYHPGRGFLRTLWHLTGCGMGCRLRTWTRKTASSATRMARRKPPLGTQFLSKGREYVHTTTIVKWTTQNFKERVDMDQKVLDTLKEPSADRRTPVVLHEVGGESVVTLYVFTDAEAYELKMWDKVLWTFNRRFEWEEAHPVRAFTWRYLGFGGPFVRFSDTYPALDTGIGNV